MHIDIAALTSKGQFTIPGKFRDLLRLSAGSKMNIRGQGSSFANFINWFCIARSLGSLAARERGQ